MNQHDFLIALLVFLVAAVVAVPVARRFQLGATVAALRKQYVPGQAF